MARWSIAANKGAGNVQSVALLVAAAASMRRAKIYDWTLGCGASPADNSFTHIGQRCTTAGTGAALTPNSLDAGDTLASTIVCKDTVTVDPTLTAAAFAFRKPLNQRATFRWVAAPYGELIIPATASNGFALGLSAATTTSFDYDVHFEEY
jgi:hypothetical protein